MFGLSFWYFLYPYMHISPFFLLWMLSSCFYCFVFFFKKEKIVLLFSLFSCCWVGSFMKWSIFVKCDIKHANKCVRVHLTTGGVFLFIHVFDIFNCRLFLLQFHHFFHFLCGFAVFLIVQCPPQKLRCTGWSLVLHCLLLSKKSVLHVHVCYDEGDQN